MNYLSRTPTGAGGQQGMAHPHSRALCHLPRTAQCWCWEQIDRMRLAGAVNKTQPKPGIHTHPSDINELCERASIHAILQNRMPQQP